MNQCLVGAVMFLFRGDFGCLLYSGDFRWEAVSERASLARNSLIGALNGGAVDILYLDNTYCNPSYDFPPREIAAQQVYCYFLLIYFNLQDRCQNHDSGKKIMITGC